LAEGKIVPVVPLRHEAKQTQPFGISEFNKGVSILPSETNALLELFCH